MNPDEYAEEVAYFQWCDEQDGIAYQWKQYAILTALVIDAEDTAAFVWKRELDAIADTD